jgi:hypothetical protein
VLYEVKYLSKGNWKGCSKNCPNLRFYPVIGGIEETYKVRVCSFQLKNKISRT